MLRAPLLLPAIAFVLAIVAEQHGCALAAVAGGTLAAAVLLAAVRERGERAIASAVVLACTAGILVSIARGHPGVIEHERATARYAATVVGDVRTFDENGGVDTALAIDEIGTVRVSLRTPLEPGERIIVRGRIEPFDEPRNPGEPSMRDIERDEGFVARLAAAHVLRRSGPDPGDARTWAARLRAVASRRLRALVPQPSAAILAGAAWGERGSLPEDLRDAFQATGTVHVLVTAGLHLGVVAAIAVLLLRLAGVPRIAGCAVVSVVVLAYVWFSGAHLPSQRAAVMIGVALVARACGARVTSWNALALAAIVVAAAWPVAVGSASFALSFSCVSAIVLFAEPIAERLGGLLGPARLREALALTCATQLGTWPLTVAVFSTLAPYAILANAIVVPLVACALVGIVPALAIPPLAPAETAVLFAIEGTVRAIAALPGARATLAAPPPSLIVAYDAFALAAGLLLRRDHIAFACAVLVAGSAIVVLPSYAHPRHGLQIISLDVGQGDAAVIRTPSDRTILIDTGGELERGTGVASSAERAGARVVLAYLKRAGITRIDLMVLTHPHGDHVGSAAPIIDAMPVGMIFDSGQTYAGRAYRDAMAAAHSHGVPIVLARRGIRWTSGDGVTLDVLAPSMPFLAETGDDVNENSIVVMLYAGAFRELFMGDAGEASEARLLALCHPEQRRGAAEDAAGGGPSASLGTTMCDDDLHADVLKVGHHGSRYASTPKFVTAVHPRFAVISVGRHNTFGHPAEATVEAWRDVGADVLRTDRCGAISLLDGSPATMLSCASP